MTLATRSKSGCVECRRRKRKCCERHPVCRACQQRGVACDWQVQRPQPLATRRRRQQNKDFEVSLDMENYTSAFTAPSATITDELLAHFRAASPLWLTLGGEWKRRTCVDLLMPVALRNPLVFNSVLALAAGDLSKYRPSTSDLSSLSHGFYGQAIAGLRPALADSFSSGMAASDDALLAVLLLAVHEAQNFTQCDRLLPHLNAAAVMCHNRAFAPSESPQLRALLFEVFCYMFTLTAFSHGQRLQLQLASEVLTSPYLFDTPYQGVLLGPCRSVFFCILRVATLCTIASSGDPEADGELEAIERQLSDSSLPVYDVTSNGEEIMACELYRIACLIYVKRSLHPENAHRSSEIQSLVAHFLGTLHALPPSSPTNGILLWPLVVTGMSAQVNTHQRLISGRIRRNHQTWRTNILSNSVQFLSQTWNKEKSIETYSSPSQVTTASSKSDMPRSVGREAISCSIVLL